MRLATPTPRLPSVEDYPPLLQDLAHRRYLGAATRRFAPSFASTPQKRSSTERGHSGFSVGKDHRCRRRPRLRGGKKVKGRKGHLLVDTEGLVLKAKVHVANVVDQEGIKPLLDGAKELFPRLSHLWLDAGYRGQEKGRGWALRRL